MWSSTDGSGRARSWDDSLCIRRSHVVMCRLAFAPKGDAVICLLVLPHALPDRTVPCHAMPPASRCLVHSDAVQNAPASLADFFWVRGQAFSAPVRLTTLRRGAWCSPKAD